MSRTCPYCSSTEIDEDPSRGDATCMDCGTVLEESRIVTEAQFQETKGGATEVIGQFISQDKASSGGPGQPKPESREATHAKGKKVILEIASQLRINQHCIDTAYNFFKLCVSSNYTRGRRRTHVVVACLYMTCRLENTSHLLLDFSDVTQINVYDLGRTFNFLSRSLKISLPATDPCLYILRFAIMLDFGDKQRDIVSLATRIVQRMKRDWISTGRRPTGLCGAALLLAARAFNVNRGVSDIVRIVHISDSVVRKRLDEFANTPSGNLTIDEFNTVDLEECADPPAYQRARMRQLIENKRKEEETQADQATQEFENVHEAVELALRKKAKNSSNNSGLNSQPRDTTIPELQEVQAQLEMIQPEIIDDIHLSAESNRIQDEQSSFREKPKNYGPTLQSLGLARQDRSAPSSALNSQQTASQQQQENLPEENIDLIFDDLDEDELDAYILSEQEVKVKTNFWMARNGKHMEEMEKKRQAKLEEEEQQRLNPKKKRKVTRKKPITAENVNDAMFQVIQEKNLSNKINYDILKELGGENPFLLNDVDLSPELQTPVKVQPTSQPTDEKPLDSVGPINSLFLQTQPVKGAPETDFIKPEDRMKEPQSEETKITIQPKSADTPKPKTSSRYKHRSMPMAMRAKK